MAQFLALLRGINVGGNNIIRMADLKGCFEAHGFANVATYIQSGNVLFEANERNQAKLGGQVEHALWLTFGSQLPVVLLSLDQVESIVAQAPAGFGGEPGLYRYDVIFLKEPLTAAEAIQDVKVKEGVDQAAAGDIALYFSRLISRASQSYLSRVIVLPVYQRMTIRNWNTTIKLLALMGNREKERR